MKLFAISDLHLNHKVNRLALEALPPQHDDWLIIAGDATFAGVLDVSLIDGFELGMGQEFEIIDIAGARSGAFAGLAEGALVGTFGSEELFITYAGGDGNDVTLFVPGLVGDYNGDGIVDTADFNVWQETLGSTGVGLAADGNNDGEVTQLDFDVWRGNFGASASLNIGGDAVPEPGALLLLGLGATFFIVVNHGRNGRRVG